MSLPSESPPDRIKEAADGFEGLNNLTSLKKVTLDACGLFSFAGLWMTSYRSRIGCASLSKEGNVSMEKLRGEIFSLFIGEALFLVGGLASSLCSSADSCAALDVEAKEQLC